MDLPKLCFLPDFPKQNRRHYEVILSEVFKKLPEDVQQNLQKKCEILVLGYNLGVTRTPMKISSIILNSLAMNIEDRRVGANLKRDLHILAHEFAHVYLDHGEPSEETEKEANKLAKSWGFVAPKD